MQELPLPFTDATEQLLRSLDGPVALTGRQGAYVAMRQDVFEAMLGIGDDESAESLASTLRGVADLEAGRTHDVDEAFDKLDARDA